MERPEEVVLDASVVVKWFSEEEGTDRAVSLRDEHIQGKRTIVAPDLLVYEVENALRFRPGLGPDEATKAIECLFDIQLDLITPSKELLKKSAQHAFKYGITIYDSCYLALADFLGAYIITADTQTFKRAKKCGFIRLL
jgi:predicted nucleic acid-binding protein